MITPVIFGAACFRWPRAVACDDPAASAVGGAGADGRRSRSWPSCRAGLPVWAGAGEFPALGAFVLAGLPSCLACCCGDSGAAGVSADGGRGQRRAGAAGRFWGGWRVGGALV